MVSEKSFPTEVNNTKIYNATTLPGDAIATKKKPKRRDKSDLGPDFVAPDGGWGWVVCVAAGFSNFSIFPPLQQYGLIYRQRMKSFEFNAKQITTIVNVVMAVSSLLGIVNGAMFRRFTFRQVAIAGGFLVFIGIFTSAFSQTFLQYIFSISCTYGIGYGLCTAATSLAVNTYFKLRRRRATGFSWTISGLGSIIFPHISTVLMANYGAQRSILIYSGLALNAILCGCTLQPVLWHVEKAVTEKNEHELETMASKLDSNQTEVNTECEYCRYKKQNQCKTIFTIDDSEQPRYEVIEPIVPMLTRSKDGWFGSKMSLTSEKSRQYRQRLLRCASMKSREDVEEASVDSHHLAENGLQNKSKFSYNDIGLGNECPHEHRCTCSEERALLQTITDEELRQETENLKADEAAEEEVRNKMTLVQKVVKFFDLDLLKDFTFVNLSLGMTIMMFGEINFSVLTPFILNSYGYTDQQISLAMSFLGGMDITVRFLAPLALEKVKLGNRVLFSFGIIAVSVARFIVTITDSYHIMLAVFVLVGFGKGFRTVFSSLIIPSYVPLKRLPAASGLQLISNTIFTLAFGPILGSITDAFNFTVTIHFINFLTAIALMLWIAEAIVRKLLNKPAVLMDQ